MAYTSFPLRQVPAHNDFVQISLQKNYSPLQNNLENVILSTRIHLAITYRRRTEPQLQPPKVLFSQSWGVYRQISNTFKAGVGR
jgi:hypothetical protein